jgi:hypothetical protein
MLLHTIKGGGKYRIAADERFNQNIVFNQKYFRMGILKPTDINIGTR